MAFSVLLAAVRYARIRAGSAAAHHDVRGVWLPVARAVADGTPLYTGGAVDNKPPLFEYLNLAVAATGHYLPVFLLLVALANGTLAVALWRFHARNGRHDRGVLAAAFFLLAVPLVGGHAVNVRSFALVAVVAAFWLSGPGRAGGAVAVAGLISQYALLAAPVVAYDRVAGARTRRQVRWTARFLVALCGVIAAAYASVGLFWGRASLTGALYWSVGFARTYVLAWGPSLWNSPGTWLSIHAAVAAWLTPLFLLAGVGVATALRRSVPGGSPGWTPRHLVLSGVFAVPLLIRSLPTYWLYVLPWVASLAAVGAVTVAADWT